MLRCATCGRYLPVCTCVKRRALLVGAPLVLATIASRTVWARDLQGPGSACGSCVPSGATQRVVP